MAPGRGWNGVIRADRSARYIFPNAGTQHWDLVREKALKALATAHTGPKMQELRVFPRCDGAGTPQITYSS